MKDGLTGRVTLYRESESGLTRYVEHEIKFDVDQSVLIIEQVDDRFVNDKLVMKIEIKNEVRTYMEYLRKKVKDLENELDSYLYEDDDDEYHSI
ncbi:MAG: hypothetical protein NWE90_07375 [Candidatus Bathyarchaeota archaeon]|nr:hypothetical protein [Candidatus Bathyarchaeota archaeon]